MGQRMVSLNSLEKAYDSIRTEVQETCTQDHSCVKLSSYFQYYLTLVGW
jgi:hypothetical protein